MDQGTEGEFRFIEVSVGPYTPPLARDVPVLMTDMVGWWNARSEELSPVLSSAILHYRFEAIHPFGDCNGRTGRALALWELYRRGFDTHHIFSVDEYFWEDRSAYYAALSQVRDSGEDLSEWLEYSAAGVLQTLERVWGRIQTVQPEGAEPLVLRPRQERLLQLLRDTGAMAPAEIWEALGVSRQGAMDLIKPLIDAGVVEKVGTQEDRALPAEAVGCPRHRLEHVLDRVEGIRGVLEVEVLQRQVELGVEDHAHTLDQLDHFAEQARTVDQQVENGRIHEVVRGQGLASSSGARLPDRARSGRARGSRRS